MADHPTRPRSSATIPAIPKVERESSRPSIDSDRGEIFLRELANVEARTAATTQKALADLSAVYERELERRDDVIRQLQDQGRQAASADMALSRELTNLRMEMTATISSAVTLEVSKHTVSATEAKTIAQGENKTTKLWSVILSSVVAGVVAGSALAVKSCEEPKAVTVPIPTVPQAGPGFAGRP